MGAPLSMDLRIRAIALYDEGKLKKKEIALMFKIDVKTLYNWDKRRKCTNDLSPKKPVSTGGRSKIKDIQKFERFIEENPNYTMQELAEKWGGVSRSAIGRMLKKRGYRFKKNSLDTKNETKKSELYFWKK